MPGPAPKPILVKRREGNPGGKKLIDREPRPLPKVPPCPQVVRSNPDAYSKWKDCVAILTADGNKVLTVADGDLLAQYCLVHAEILSLFYEWNGARRELLDADNDPADGQPDTEVAMNPATVEGRAAIRQARERAIVRQNRERLLFTQLTVDRKLYLQYQRELGLGPVSRLKVQVVGEAVASNDPWAEFDEPSSSAPSSAG